MAAILLSELCCFWLDLDLGLFVMLQDLARQSLVDFGPAWVVGRVEVAWSVRR